MGLDHPKMKNFYKINSKIAVIYGKPDMFNPKTIYLNDLLTISDNKRDNLILEKKIITI